MLFGRNFRKEINKKINVAKSSFSMAVNLHREAVDKYDEAAQMFAEAEISLRDEIKDLETTLQIAGQ
jgi:predicted DNA-binding protein YlxM (UPF0122 family)